MYEAFSLVFGALLGFLAAVAALLLCVGACVLVVEVFVRVFGEK